VQEYIQKSADIENDAIPIINTCIAGIVSVAKTVSHEEVCVFLQFSQYGAITTAVIYSALSCR